MFSKELPVRKAAQFMLGSAAGCLQVKIGLKTIAAFPDDGFVDVEDSNGNRYRVRIDPVAICPECKAGKHPNCDGQAWDMDKDEPTQCACKEC